jgi:hypothetical protein
LFQNLMFAVSSEILKQVQDGYKGQKVLLMNL